MLEKLQHLRFHGLIFGQTKSFIMTKPAAIADILTYQQSRNNKALSLCRTFKVNSTIDKKHVGGHSNISVSDIRLVSIRTHFTKIESIIDLASNAATYSVVT